MKFLKAKWHENTLPFYKYSHENLSKSTSTPMSIKRKHNDATVTYLQ